MSALTRFLYLLLAAIMSFTSLPLLSTSKRAEKFRLVAYYVANNLNEGSAVDGSHFEDLTDIILFGIATFNAEGNIILSENFETALSKIREAIGNSRVNVYLNLIGPGATEQHDDWYEQMKSQSKQHNLAFASGNLEGSIKQVLEKYALDGIFFDYEYPVTKEDWGEFDKFLISLDKALGDKFKIGCAISAGLTMQSRKSIAVTDMVEVMAYDVWDEDGTHSSVDAMKGCVRSLLRKGYRREQMDIGIPFYGRPTDRGAYWYAYNGYYDRLDEKGFCTDDATGLTFSFNTCDTVYEKTFWSICSGFGGAMVWHYACDLPKSNEKSLFNAMAKAKAELAEK